MIVPKSLNERPVAPGPPAKSVSPVNTALSPAATAVYLCTRAYAPAVDRELNPFDPDLAISWPGDGEQIVSDKDRSAPSLAELLEAGLLPDYAECLRFREELRARAAARGGPSAPAS